MQCGTPISSSEVIRLGHGSGGKLTADLIDRVFIPGLGDCFGGQLEDAAVVGVGSQSIAVTTDAYVVKPYRFPGGDIASLAVHGTVNDLAVRGARPLFISAAFIIEEGFAISELRLLVESMRRACAQCGITLVAADTKVVNKGACDGIYITTTGVGEMVGSTAPSARGARAGDAILVSGQLGMHGMAVLCAREDLELEHEIVSDSAPLHEITAELMSLGASVHCMRDITRGGLVSVLAEIAEASECGMEIEEQKIPVHPQVAAACELLGLDPLFVACEGRLVAIVDAPVVDQALELIRRFEVGRDAEVIGKVTDDHPKRVIMRSRIGGRRFLDRLAGDQLPRIC